MKHNEEIMLEEKYLAKIVCRGRLLPNRTFKADNKQENTLKKGDHVVFVDEDKNEVGFDYKGPVWVCKLQLQ